MDADHVVDPHRVADLEALEALYGAPPARSLSKELDRISAPYRALIDAAPFLVLASVGKEGLDCSPRGDPAGICVVEDEKTVFLPDRRGNNRIDSLRNIVADPRVALLFLIPGVDETLRLNGRAEIRIDPDLRARFAMDGKQPATVLRVTVDSVYFQCAKALIRSRLWRVESQVDRKALPSAGDILKDIDAEFDNEAYDSALSDRVRRTIY